MDIDDGNDDGNDDDNDGGVICIYKYLWENSYIYNF